MITVTEIPFLELKLVHNSYSKAIRPVEIQIILNTEYFQKL